MDYIVYVKIEKVETCIEDVPNQKVKQKLEELAKIALHYTLLSSLSEINQFIEGLNVHGLLDLLREHPQKAGRLFLYTENQLNAELVDNLFVPLFSPKESNKGAAEELVSLNFTRYLEDVESGGVTSKIVDLNTNEESELQVTMPALLQFITGSSSVPPLGFVDKPPSITFQHDASGRKLSANTCANTLHLPVNNTFKVEFTSCMAESPGFGNVWRNVAMNIELLETYCFIDFLWFVTMHVTSMFTIHNK